MKKHVRTASLVLAGLLHIAPIVSRVAQNAPALARSPIAIVMTWAIRVAAIAGAYHTVSAASAVLVSATTISGTQGTRLSYQVRINDGQNRTPESWKIAGVIYNSTRVPNTITNGMPPGLAIALATGIISGTPTTAGSFPTPITAYESPNGGGAALAFTLTFNIAAVTQPTAISTQPVSAALHEGETLSLHVAATGTAPFSYKWQKDAVDIPGATTDTYSLTNITGLAAGSYVAIVTGAGGPATSNPAVITVTPLTISSPTHAPGSTTLQLSTISGRHYIIQSTPSLSPAAWSTAGELTAGTATAQFTDASPETSERYWRYYPSP